MLAHIHSFEEDPSGARPHLVLLDNIDAIAQRFPSASPSFSPSSSNSSVLSAGGVAMGSFLCSVLDSLRDRRSASGLALRPYVIATCSDPSGLPPALLRPYRLGTPLAVPLPDSQGRVEVAARIMRQSPSSSCKPLPRQMPVSSTYLARVTCDSSISHAYLCVWHVVGDETFVQEVAHEIARRSQVGVARIASAR
jgi:SpoVK/Ycf46/Vps4 family AAA+-type ATPase